MPKYTVSMTIKSGDNPAVDMQWYRGDNLAQAISAMVGATADHVDTDASMPDALRFRTLGVRLSIEQEVAPSATPSTEDPFFDDFDTEAESLALSDCIYWDSPRDTECAGPRVGTAIRRDDSNIVVVCERHFNSPPQ